MNNWHCISFFARLYFFIFQFPHVFRKFSVVNVLFVVEISCVVLKQSLNVVSAIIKYFLSGLVGADTTALYTIFAVKHLLPSGHSALFLQLHLCLLEVGWITLRWFDLELIFLTLYFVERSYILVTFSLTYLL